MDMSSHAPVQPASFEQFERAAQRGNVVAVFRTICEHQTNPVDAFVSLSKRADYAFLLESVEGADKIAKYSFIGANPHMIARGIGNQTLIENDSALATVADRLPNHIKRHFRERKLANPEGLPPLAGGVVGYFGYGSARWFEPALEHIANQAVPDTDGLLMFYRNIVVFDHEQGNTKVVATVFTEDAEGPSLKRLYEQAVSETLRMEAFLNSPPTISEEHSDYSLDETCALVASNWTKEDFESAVDSIKEYILAGDCYQAVISQRFKKRITKLVNDNPIRIYRALRESNPSPYMYFLKMETETVIGASPEMLVRCRGRKLDYRPIAGTRPRGADASDDHRLAEEMRRDEKEVAEHMMLVDLGRNDLGRVAEYGTVKVEELMSVEQYSKVQHLVSSLSARSRDDVDRFDALAACFPAGTVTGAPKLRAMEIIDELEPEPRGLYAGAVLYADYAGNLDSCIAIRTIVLKDGEASVQAGAGIVADSIAELEYEETVQKARALFRAIEMAEAGSCPG